MRKTTLYIACTLDGYIASKDGSIDWLKEYENTNSKEDYGYYAFYKKTQVVVMGNNTYKQVLTFGDFPYKGKTTYVFTRKKQKPNKDVIFTKNINDIKKLNKHIWLVGGSEIIKTFMKNNLVDEYIITIIPKTIGQGIPLFQEKSNLKLKKSKTYKTGLVQLTYKNEKL